MRQGRPIPRGLRRGCALFLVTAVVCSILAPGAGAASPRSSALPLAGLPELSPQRLVADFLEWLGTATTHLTSAARGVGQPTASGPQAHFGFGQGNLLAQVTGTAVLGTVSPTASVSLTPPAAGTGTPTPPTLTAVPTPSVLTTPTVGIPGPPIHPSRGELVPGHATAIPSQGTLRLQAVRSAGRPHAVLDQCAPNVQVSAQVNGQQALQVTISAGGTGNLIQRVYFPRQSAQNAGDRFTNAFVSFADQVISAEILDVTYILTPPVAALTLWVAAVVPGQATHVPMVVTDNCGDWQTFAGAGTSAGLSCLWTEAVPSGSEHNPPYINGGTVGGVHTLTGSFSTSHTDVSLAGRGPTPQLTRAYNSNDPRPGPLGQNWTHSYATHLARPPDGTQDICKLRL